MQQQRTHLIPLRARDGSIRDYAMVDDADVWALEYRWHLSNGYARRTGPADGTRDPSGKLKRRDIALHVEILERMGHAKDAYDVGDHIDRDPLNCRRSNLRPATFAQNAQNRIWANPPGHKNRRLPDPEPRPCGTCGDPFIPRRKTANIAKARYCSLACQRAAVMDHSSETQRARARLPRPRS